MGRADNTLSMKRNKDKQLQLFTSEEMKGGVKPRDHFMEENVAAYLKYMQKLSELDDDACRAILMECEKVCNNSIDEMYKMKTLGCTLDVIHFLALSELVKMRLYSFINDEYSHHDEPLYRAKVTFPSAFIKAREVFKKDYSKKYNGKDAWIVELGCQHLTCSNCRID